MKFKKDVSAGGIVYLPRTKSHLVGGTKWGKEERLWLVIKHSKYKKWTFPKGLVGDQKANEVMEEAALREVQEEGGVKAKIANDKLVKVGYKYRLEEYLVDKTVYYFLMEYASGDPKDHDREVSEAKFIGAQSVKKILDFESDKEAFEKILKII